MKGGYQIIDLKGIKLINGGASIKVEGLWTRLEQLDHSKPIILENVVLEGEGETEQSRGGIWVNVTYDGMYYMYPYMMTSNSYLEVHRDSTIQYNT